MSKINLSIIIPVYNVQEYLRQCLDSVIKQGLSNIEIILVNDGSTDNSGNICDDYAKKYSYIKVVHQKNKGLSGARNTGIRNSTGKYLMFIDSDDFINSKVDLKKIVMNLKKDITQYKWVYYYENSNKYTKFKDMEIYSDEDIDELLLKKVFDGTFSVSACDKIIKKSLIVDNDIYFKEGIYSEDMDWTFRLYEKISSYDILNEDVYIYRQARKGSITNKIKNKNVVDLFGIIKYWYNYDYKSDKLKEAYLNYLAYHYVILITLLNKENCSKELKKDIYKLQDILKYSNNKKVKMCSKLFSIFGKKISIKILRFYIYLKNLGLIKL